MNDGSPGSVNGYSHVELPNGNIAVSYGVAVVKDLGGGVTDGIQDVYVRVFDPSTGLPVTDEVNLTNGSVTSYFDHIVATDTSGFIVNIFDNNGQRYSVTDQGVTLDSHVGFRTSGTDLIWRSEEDPNISLVLNETKPQVNDGSPSSVNGYSNVELPNGNIAVSYSLSVVKDLGGGITDGIQDVYVRVFDPSTGLPVTDEVNLTNGSVTSYFDHIVVAAVGNVSYSLSDDAGGLFSIGEASGEVTVNGPLDYEAVGGASHDITVVAASDDGSSSSQSFTISVTDDLDEHDVTEISDIDGSPNQVPENVSGPQLASLYLPLTQTR